MKVKIKSNKLQVGRSITVELLKPVRVNGKPTHEFLFTRTLKTRWWAFGKLRPTAKKKLYEFWIALEGRLEYAKPESRNRIIAQVEAVIPRLSDADFAEQRAKIQRIAKEWDEWRQSPEAAKMRRQLDAEVLRESRLRQ